ncbi:unnamed protein product, partial [marine sediment metagenome]
TSLISGTIGKKDTRKPTIIAKSQKMKDVLNAATKAAETKVTVLLLGESGTGKGLIASYIHWHSSRKDKPFIALNCANIPITLLESELFGYERGAFTGANKTKPGQFELANHGTVFLDEIGATPKETQVKLLRVLEKQEFIRLGGEKTIKVDVRIISATNQNLFKLVQQGEFREDLYYRLNVFPISIPSLREHKEDIIPLTEYYLSEYAKEQGKQVNIIDSDVLQILQNYSWPGNVRELQNITQNALVWCEGEQITLKDLKHVETQLDEEFPESEPSKSYVLPAPFKLKPFSGFVETLTKYFSERNSQGLKRYFVSRSTSKDKCLNAEYLRKSESIIQNIEFLIEKNIIRIPRNLTPRSFKPYMLKNQQFLAGKDSERNLLWHINTMVKAPKVDLYDACCSQLLAEVIVNNIPSEPLIGNYPFKFKIENDIVRPNGNKT